MTARFSKRKVDTVQNSEELDGAVLIKYSEEPVSISQEGKLCWAREQSKWQNLRRSEIEDAEME